LLLLLGEDSRWRLVESDVSALTLLIVPVGGVLGFGGRTGGGVLSPSLPMVAVVVDDAGVDLIAVPEVLLLSLLVILLVSAERG